MSANDRQVAGDHYSRRGELQHWDVVLHLGLDYLRGNFTKYMFRWKDKNGIQDLEKAEHYLQKFIETWNRAPWTFTWLGRAYCGIRVIAYDPIFFAHIVDHFDIDAQQEAVIQAVVYADSYEMLDMGQRMLTQYIHDARVWPEKYLKAAKVPLPPPKHP